MTDSDAGIASRVAVYNRHTAVWTAIAMDRSCTGFMHLPTRQHDPDSISASRLRDSVLMGGEEIAYLWPTEGDEPEQEVEEDHQGLFRKGASDKSRTVELEDQMLHLQVATSKSDESRELDPRSVQAPANQPHAREKASSAEPQSSRTCYFTMPASL